MKSVSDFSVNCLTIHCPFSALAQTTKQNHRPSSLKIVLELITLPHEKRKTPFAYFLRPASSGISSTHPASSEISSMSKSRQYLQDLTFLINAYV